VSREHGRNNEYYPFGRRSCSVRCPRRIRWWWTCHQVVQEGRKEVTDDLIRSHFRYIDANNNDDLLTTGETVPTRQQISEYLEEIDESTLLMDGFEDAFIGFSRRINDPLLAVYSWEKMVEVLMRRDGMTYDDATEYIDFNCIGAWVGEQTPIIVMPIS